MKRKEKVISIFIGLVTCVALISLSIISNRNDNAKLYYQVYLNGDKIGIIYDENDLYSLINKKQMAIKEKYEVDNVYPPNNLDITKIYTYSDKVDDINDVYNLIEKNDDFTIRGYSIIIKYDNNVQTSEEGSADSKKEDVVINVLDKKVFEEAVYNFIYAFVDENQYNAYINGTQSEIYDVGNLIEDMYFNESITIKETYISVNDKIYTDASELSQYLLFGSSSEQKSYTVKDGDTIDSISEANKLNVQEFLIANPKFSSEDSLLAINDQVNVTLINPILTLTYQMYSVEDVEEHYSKNVVYNNSLPSSYSEITTPGSNGITRVTYRYAVINGEQSQGLVKLSEEVLRKKVDQVTTKGKKVTSWGNYGSYVDTNGDWGWPTNQPYKITSRYAWRWGKLHEGIDISGVATGSPIYAAGDGEVLFAADTNKDAGTYVVIKHANNIHTIYAHMQKKSIKVSVGQMVKKGQVIGALGATGFATGPHLHFGVFNGYPLRSPSVNPCKLYSGMCR